MIWNRAYDRTAEQRAMLSGVNQHRPATALHSSCSSCRHFSSEYGPINVRDFER
ncbi:hypothetical protein SERLADRAFT_456862 [Serpula lacrymans var. lacrymans S7.9]|uniref:Uncharacterized protein n=1 Tax=Serpula lacrymans var. lacrymans (strain S7.9) TaxID=578457 RepID=F8NJ15_SERL9|nr:uncharacterized protein SERLADRAFT_456862 [Serpula lacrymans var. lacrymans S7.9]EGO29296.1 hypothetical protein SERLADRAFT_456862 [Serpula lacrymans var. lacrymans S7.9]